MTQRSQFTVIELKPSFPGHRRFFGPWVHRGCFRYVVDVGPASCSQQLVSELKAMDIDTIDYVFLTHIHIDHTGGLAGLLSAYPETKVVCHEQAVEHLLDPTHLWEASRKVLGITAERYGRPSSVPRQVLIPHSQWSGDNIRIIETPGHAPHHLSFLHNGTLFVGEAAGHYQALPNCMEYHRPATPPRFLFHKALASVEKLLELEDVRICYAHYGMLPSSKNALVRFKKQLLLWWEITCEFLRSCADLDTTESMIRTLLKEDANIQGLKHMDKDSRTREHYFMSNSVRGFVDYAQENSDFSQATGTKYN